MLLSTLVQRVIQPVCGIVFVFSVAGCATYANYDYYEPDNGGQTKPLSVHRFGFLPLQGFGSLGPVGLPVVPVTLPSQNETLTLEINIDHHGNIPFSIKQRPCISLENGEEICANKYQVGGFVENRKLEWPNNRRLIDLDPNDTRNDISRITRDQIFNKANFSFTPDWDWLVLTVSFEFQCSHICPNTFALDSSDLLSIDDKNRFDKKVKYTRRTRSKYDPLVNFTN